MESFKDVIPRTKIFFREIALIQPELVVSLARTRVVHFFVGRKSSVKS
jgi:hypothetical protein